MPVTPRKMRGQAEADPQDAGDGATEVTGVEREAPVVPRLVEHVALLGQAVVQDLARVLVERDEHVPSPSLTGPRVEPSGEPGLVHAGLVLPRAVDVVHPPIRELLPVDVGGAVEADRLAPGLLARGQVLGVGPQRVVALRGGGVLEPGAHVRERERGAGERHDQERCPHHDADDLVEGHVEREPPPTAPDHERRGPPADPRPVPEVEAAEQHDDEAHREPGDHVHAVGDDVADDALHATRLVAVGPRSAPAVVGVEHTEEPRGPATGTRDRGTASGWRPPTRSSGR